MKLWLTRHGQTDYNRQGIYCGSTDILLNELGLQQARQLATAPELAQIDVIISSPLLRALQTALTVQRAIDKPLHVVPGFAERSVGVFEGLSRQEAQQRYPELWQQDCLRSEQIAPEGGETLRDFTKRIEPALRYLQRTYAGQTLLLVGHGGVAREINRLYRGLGYEETHDFSMANCQLICYEGEAKGLALE